MNLKKTNTHLILSETVKSFLKKHNCKNIICAFSGGADSTTLLHILKALKKELGFNLTALHINHNLRGKESKRDEKFAKDFCKKLNIDLIVENANVLKLSKNNKLSIEDAARRLRLEVYKKTSSQIKNSVIFTAHTKDDQIETVLMKLFRGCGLKGACGMKPFSEINGIKIARPLLKVNKSQILAYINKHKLKFVEDSSNKDNRFTRNLFRNKIIPYLNKTIGSVEKIYSFSEICGDFYDFYLQTSKKLFKKYFLNPKERICIKKEFFTKIPFFVCIDYIKIKIEETFGNSKIPSKKDFSEIFSYALCSQPGKYYDINKEIILLNDRTYLFILKRKELFYKKRLIISAQDKNPVDFFQWKLTVNSKNIRPYSGKNWIEDLISGKTIYYNLNIENAKESSFITIRSFENGDKVKSRSFGEKKVKKLFTNAQVPLFLKKQIPIIELNEKIIKIPFIFEET